MTGKRRRRLYWLKATKKQRKLGRLLDQVIVAIWNSFPSEPIDWSTLRVHTSEESLAWIEQRREDKTNAEQLRSTQRST